MLITLFAPDNVHLLEIAGVRDTLFEANSQVPAGKQYRVRLVTEHGISVQSASGVTFVPDAGIEQATGPSDTLIVVGPYGVPSQPSPQVAQWLRDQADQARRYGSTCTGAFLMADAGLLSGRRATTHWQYAHRLAAAHPDIMVEPDRIFVRDGPVFSSAGVAAAIDLTLSLIEEDYGRALALFVARRLVVFLKRPGGQSQFSTTLLAQAETSGPIDQIRHLVLENPRRELGLATVAEEVGVSPRHLSRLFHAAQGRSLAEYVESVRVESARRLLEEGSAPIKAIAFAAGFGSTTTLRRAFLRSLGVSPQDYRARFQSTGAGDNRNAATLS